MVSFKFLQETYSKNISKFLEMISLTLMLLSLPSFEAPKNIFLILFLTIALFREWSQKKNKSWEFWDWIFLSYILSSFLSAIFAGFSTSEVWGGFRSILIWTGFAWLLSRSKYNPQEITWIIWIAILGTLPPLIWGLIEYLVIHTKSALELHSVGHVNHSAIYLGIVLGAALSVSLSNWKTDGIFKKLISLSLPIFFFIAIIIGQSRGVFGVSLIRITLIILLIPNSKKIKLMAFGIFGIILALMPIMDAAIIQKQTANQHLNDVFSDRERAWNVSIESAHFFPILGVGNGNWKNITLNDLKKSRDARNLPFDERIYGIEHHHSHSIYLTALVERGIIGFICLILLMASWLLLLIKTYANLEKIPQGAYLWGCSLSAWIVTFGVGVINSTFHHEHAILALLFLGLHLSFVNQLPTKKLKIRNNYA
ncbi:O-antigen ligase family protein [Candidatus Methylopumilus universalis]|uniref:O-antigen ligase family protein n=1 Tax=Candidatus Methylopumilus universalis TaxID=2588536 RepID=UPI0011203BDF|nr:O-antigen ligase family protein [Candidatus Methylopumilus universalis]QDC70758.1 O-antigen ligase family protein [Candidatus Methylopumilus universalis]